MHPYSELSNLVIGLSVFLRLAAGDCQFRKHFGLKLPEPKETSLIQDVRGVLQCEELCLGCSNRCVAANVIYLGANLYSCEVLARLPESFEVNQLVSNPRGKFIYKADTTDNCITSFCQHGGSCVDVGVSLICRCPTYYSGVYCQLGPHKLTISSCSTGTIQNSKYACENAYDGVLDPGDYNEWSGQRTDDNVWIRLDLPSAKTVIIIRIWWRCQGAAQFSRLDLEFSDGSSQTITHHCSEETYWLGCSADDPEEVFYIDPVYTTYVHISGVDCELNSGYNGLREIEIWGA